MAPGVVYQPLLNSHDRLARIPLGQWRDALCTRLHQAVAGPEPDFEAIAGVLNQLALVDAYQGRGAAAERLCVLQVDFWKNASAAPGREALLGFVIQPWINLVRLERWETRMDNSSTLYREFAPARRTSQGRLQERFAIGLSLHQLIELSADPDIQGVLDNVYWREYARLLLQTGRHEALQAHLQQGLKAETGGYVRLALLEILLLYQAKIGKHAHALDLLRTLRIDDASQYWLHFKAMEMYLHMTSGRSDGGGLAGAILDAARTRYSNPDAYSANLLLDVARVFALTNQPDAELGMLDSAIQLAHGIGDEVVQAEAACRRAELCDGGTEQLQQRFGGTRYALVRRRLGLAALPEAPDESRVMEAVSHLSRLDYASCRAALDVARSRTVH